MYDSEDLKVLLGNSIPEPEVDYDDAEVQSETGYPVEEDALKQYYFVTVIDHMGKPDFKSNYLSVINNIKEYTTEKQKLLTDSILQKLPEKYDFEFSINFDIKQQYEIDELYQFLEFVEYNNEKFILSVWKNLNPLNKFKVEEFCNNNKIKILEEIENELDAHYYPRLIADFLRTYNKDKMVEWFCNMSQRIHTAILISREEKTNV